MTEELTGQAGGVGEQALSPGPSSMGGGEQGGQATAGGGAAGVAGGAPTTEGAAPAIARKVKLEELPEFRAYQAAFDRRYEQLRLHLEQERQQRGAMQQRLDEAQLANADPEEVAAYYRQQLAQVQQEQQNAQAAMALRQQVDDAAGKMLAEHGLDVNTPGLDWDGGPTWEGYAKLAESVAKIEALRASEQAKTTSAEVSQAAQAAKMTALEQAGVTKVSTATGAAPSGANPIADIKDPNVLLRMALAPKKGGR